MGIDRSCPLVMISNKSKPIWESGDLNCSVKTLNIPYNDKNEPDIAILGISFLIEDTSQKIISVPLKKPDKFEMDV